jgi:hypothetical protein
MAITPKTHLYVEFKDNFYPFIQGQKVFIKKEVAENEDYVNRIKILDFPNSKKAVKPKAPVVPEKTNKELIAILEEA